jgi:DNA primase
MNPEELLIKKNISYLPKGGDLEIRCLSPDHDDRNPSLRVDRITGIFNCLSCGFSGNIFQHFGVKVNFLGMKRQALKNKISEKLSENVGFDMPDNAIPYDGNWRGISPETYKHFEAFQHNDKHFIGRLVFPIRGISGRIAGFNGRHMTMNHDPKYLIHPSGAKLPLFPANPDVILGRIILVEGIYDMLNLWDKGLKNVVCSFGTVKLLGKNNTDAKNKLNLLKLKGVAGIDIFFDGDDAGQKAAEGVKNLCENLEFDTRNIVFNDKDPGELTALQVIKLKETLYG